MAKNDEAVIHYANKFGSPVFSVSYIGSFNNHPKQIQKQNDIEL